MFFDKITGHLDIKFKFQASEGRRKRILSRLERNLQFFNEMQILFNAEILICDNRKKHDFIVLELVNYRIFFQEKSDNLGLSGWRGELKYFPIDKMDEKKYQELDSYFIFHIKNASSENCIKMCFNISTSIAESIPKDPDQLNTLYNLEKNELDFVEAKRAILCMRKEVESVLES